MWTITLFIANSENIIFFRLLLCGGLILHSLGSSRLLHVNRNTVHVKRRCCPGLALTQSSGFPDTTLPLQATHSFNPWSQELSSCMPPGVVGEAGVGGGGGEGQNGVLLASQISKSRYLFKKKW